MIVPLVVRAELPTPDAVIVRHDSGEVTIVADVTIPEQRLAEFIVDAVTDLESPGYALS